MNLIFNMRIPFLIQDRDAGSTVDREASDKERQKDIPTFKDNDFLNDRIKISIGEDAKVHTGTSGDPIHQIVSPWIRTNRIRIRNTERNASLGKFSSKFLIHRVNGKSVNKKEITG